MSKTSVFKKTFLCISMTLLLSGCAFVDAIFPPSHAQNFKTFKGRRPVSGNAMYMKIGDDTMLRVASSGQSNGAHGQSASYQGATGMTPNHRMMQMQSPQMMHMPPMNMQPQRMQMIQPRMSPPMMQQMQPQGFVPQMQVNPYQHQQMMPQRPMIQGSYGLSKMPQLSGANYASMASNQLASKGDNRRRPALNMPSVSPFRSQIANNLPHQMHAYNGQMPSQEDLHRESQSVDPDLRSVPQIPQKFIEDQRAQDAVNSRGQYMGAQAQNSQYPVNILPPHLS